MIKLIGGGSASRFRVRSQEKGAKDKTIEVMARFPLFGIRIGVIIGPVEHAGKILIPKWEDQKTDDPSKFRAWELTWQMADSVHTAYRQTFHILTQYGLDLKSGEKSAMLVAAEAAQELNLTVLGLEPGRTVTEMRSATRATYLRFSTAMGVLPRKPIKKEGMKFMTEVQVGADMRGRVNPSMAMAKSRAATHRAMARLHDEIMRIDPRIEARQKVLVNMIQLAELRLKALNDLLIKLLEHDGLLPLTLDRRRRQVVATQLTYYADDMETVDFNPYRPACMETVRDLRVIATLLAASLINAPLLKSIRRLLVNCRSAVAIKAQQIEIERLIFRLTKLLASDANAVPVISSVRKKLSVIEDQLHAINEQGFRRPVCMAARKSVAIAETLLELNGHGKIVELRLKAFPGRIAQIETAREELKKASALL